MDFTKGLYFGYNPSKKNHTLDESFGLNNDILFMKGIIGFDEGESSTRNEQKVFGHGDRNVDFDAILAEEFLE